MAMYTQVKTTAGYVGLNALEYVMQTVRTTESVCLRGLMAVLQCGAVRLGAGAVRHELPRQRERYAVVPGSTGRYRRAVCG